MLRAGRDFEAQAALELVPGGLGAEWHGVGRQVDRFRIRRLAREDRGIERGCDDGPGIRERRHHAECEERRRPGRHSTVTPLCARSRASGASSWR